MRLDGKSVLITGAGSGLGAAYAIAAAAAGAQVVVNDLNAETAEDIVNVIRDAGGVAVAEIRDISKEDGAAAAVERCVAEFGSINSLVNNAGLFTEEHLLDCSLERLRTIFDVNVIGTFNCARAAAAAMVPQGGGSIINVTSGAHTGMSGHGIYGASKGAVASFTYNWAIDLRHHGITVNAISPMAFTPMASHLTHLPPVETNVPLLVYLLSDRSKGLNGQIVRITGRHLSIMGHPANRAPVLECDEWTAELVAAAFDETLAALQVPLGVATYEISNIY